jgi:hypothetical protein
MKRKFKGNKSNKYSTSSILFFIQLFCYCIG